MEILRAALTLFVDNRVYDWTWSLRRLLCQTENYFCWSL